MASRLRAKPIRSNTLLRTLDGCRSVNARPTITRSGWITLSPPMNWSPYPRAASPFHTVRTTVDEVLRGGSGANGGKK